MKQTRIIMGMPVTVEVLAPENNPEKPEAIIDAVFDYFVYIDNTFSTYKPDSEMMRINRGEIEERDWSDDMRIIFMLAEETKQRTDGFFDIKRPVGQEDARESEKPFYDPSGIVKGWAIWQAAQLIEKHGIANYYVDAGGDIQVGGVNAECNAWSIGIKNPFKQEEIVKVVALPAGAGIATSGTYIRGDHIYNPKANTTTHELVSLTVIGPNVYEADRFATAAFAMGSRAIHFIDSLPGFAGYMIDKHGVATMTRNFKKFADGQN